ncbi:hypothetical protein GCM10028824_26380 [Hymenobacter segetis]
MARYNRLKTNGTTAVAIALDAAGDVYITGESYNGTDSDFATIKYARATGKPVWIARYNGAANGNDYPTAIAVDAAGNVYVAGYSGLGINNDYTTVKYSGAAGQQQWAAHYNGPANADDKARSISVDAAGNAYVTGNSYNGSNYDIATIKYARATGQPQWVSRYNGPANGGEAAAAVAVNAAGDAYVTGGSFNGVSSDYVTIKYAKGTGRVRWVSRYDGPANLDDRASSISLDAAGNVYVTGGSQPTNGRYDYATIKYAKATGRQLWASRYNGMGNSDDFATAMAVDAQGAVYVTGVSANPVSSDFATVKYASATGQQLWVSTYDGPDQRFDQASAIGLDAAGEVYVTGLSYSDTPRISVDYATVKYSGASGQQLWAARYNGPAGRDDYATGLAVDAAGNAYVTGFADGGDSYTTIKYARSKKGHDCDDAVTKTDRSTVADAAQPLVAFEAFPVPTHGQAVIRFQLAADSPVYLVLYDQFGTVVGTLYEGIVAAGVAQTLALPTSLPNGVYLCRLLYPGHAESLRIEVQQ